MSTDDIIASLEQGMTNEVQRELTVNRGSSIISMVELLMESSGIETKGAMCVYSYIFDAFIARQLKSRDDLDEVVEHFAGMVKRAARSRFAKDDADESRQ